MTAKEKITKNIIGFPLVLLILVIIGTVSIVGYNYYLDSKLEKLNKRISQTESEIKTLNKNENIKVYNLIKRNNPILTRMNSYSQITKFMDTILYIQKQYALKMVGFNYSNGVVKTKVETDSTMTLTPYITVSKFIEKYRKDKDAIFEISFVNKVIGYKRIGFNLSLKVKDNIKK